MEDEKTGMYQPRKGSYKRRGAYGKQRFKQAVSVKRNRTFISRGLRAPLPYKITTALLYQERVSLNTLIAASVHVFSANGLYDPNITGAGHQPRGFDQLMAMYDHCVCIKSEIRVDFPSNVSDFNPGILWVALRDFTTPGGTDQDYLEMGDCTYELSSPQGGYATRLMMQCNPNKYLGRSSPLSDPNLKNSNGANPVEQAYWHVGMQRVALDGPSLNVNVVIKYTVTFIEPKDPGSS